MDVLPWDEIDFESVLTELVSRGFLKKYVVEAKSYGWIPTFKDHQAINNKESKSVLPPYSPDTDASFTRLSRVTNATCVEGKGREGREHISVREALCAVFAKTYKEPEDRFPAEANFYKDIDHQAELITQVHKAEVAVRQIKAYVQYCKTKDRKVIGSAYKLAETILSSDWVKLLNPDARGPDNPFADAEANKKLWKEEYWKEHYKHMMNNPEFKKHFKL
jgi:hypothetical protein